MKRIYIIAILSCLLVACADTVSVDDGENSNDKNNDVANEAVDEEFSTMEEDVIIDASVILSKEDKKIYVKGETNLVAGTLLTVDVFEEAFAEKQLISHDYKVEVGSDQRFTHEVNVREDFFEVYDRRPIEVSVSIDMFGYSDDAMKEVYGERGEHFTGAIVYVSDEAVERNYIYTSVFIIVGEDEETYEITAPERINTPEDSGDINVWIEADVIDQDNDFFYVAGETNLLEGFVIEGRYYDEEDDAISQKITANRAEIQPDGTFWLPVEYEKVSKNGMIELTGYSAERTKEMVSEAYGSNLQHLKGDIVEDRGKHQRIRLGLTNDGKVLDLAQTSLVVEEKGQYKIEMSDDILFAVNESDLKNISEITLDEIIHLLEGLDDGVQVQINGHTDSKGDAKDNLKLSEARATSVENYIKEYGDVEHLSITIKGYGHTEPIASNDSAKGRQKNRRVEIVFKD